MQDRKILQFIFQKKQRKKSWLPTSGEEVFFQINYEDGKEPSKLELKGSWDITIWEEWCKGRDLQERRNKFNQYLGKVKDKILRYIYDSHATMIEFILPSDLLGVPFDQILDTEGDILGGLYEVYILPDSYRQAEIIKLEDDFISLVTIESENLRNTDNWIKRNGSCKWVFITHCCTPQILKRHLKRFWLAHICFVCHRVAISGYFEELYAKFPNEPTSIPTFLQEQKCCNNNCEKINDTFVVIDQPNRIFKKIPTALEMES